MWKQPMLIYFLVAASSTTVKISPVHADEIKNDLHTNSNSNPQSQDDDITGNAPRALFDRLRQIAGRRRGSSEEDLFTNIMDLFLDHPECCFRCYDECSATCGTTDSCYLGCMTDCRDTCVDETDEECPSSESGPSDGTSSEYDSSPSSEYESSPSSDSDSSPSRSSRRWSGSRRSSSGVDWWGSDSGSWSGSGVATASRDGSGRNGPDAASLSDFWSNENSWTDWGSISLS